MNRTSNPVNPVFTEIALLIVVFALLAFSLLMLYSTTAVLSEQRFADAFFYIKRQGLAALIGSVVLYIFSRIPLSLFQKISPWAFPIAVSLLLITMIPGLGDRAGGAQRWINLGIIRFQPVEFVKFLFVLFMAGYFVRKEDRLRGFLHGVVMPFAYVGIVGTLLLKQPDFGSTVIVATVTLGMMFAMGVRLKHIILVFSVMLAGIITMIVIEPYRLKRVLSFLSPLDEPLGAGYQLIQSLIAVASGQFSGLGLGGSQQKLYFLPAAHTDFIFAVISEELGFAGACLIILMFLLILWRGLRISGRLTGDPFKYSLAVGFTLLLVIPAFFNVGVVIGVLPTKGLVLPLVGYGGSSLVSSLAIVGVLLNLSKFQGR